MHPKAQVHIIVCILSRLFPLVVTGSGSTHTVAQSQMDQFELAPIIACTPGIFLTLKLFVQGVDKEVDRGSVVEGHDHSTHYKY